MSTESRRRLTPEERRAFYAQFDAPTEEADAISDEEWNAATARARSRAARRAGDALRQDRTREPSSLPAWSRAAKYDLVRDEFHERLTARTITQRTLDGILIERGLARPRAKVDPVSGTEHLDRKQKSRLAYLRHVLRGAESARDRYVAMYGTDSKQHATAETHVTSARKRLDEAMRRYGVTSTI
jgi:hypothetical protein